MKNIKQVLLVMEDGTYKGYNWNAFKKVMGIHFAEFLKANFEG